MTGEEVEGAYRLLCGALLQHTARLLSEVGEDGRSVANPRKGDAADGDHSYFREVARQRRVAEAWLDGGGEVPFSECCEEVGIQPEHARESLSRFLSACQTADQGKGRFATARIAKSLQAGQ